MPDPTTPQLLRRFLGNAIALYCATLLAHATIFTVAMLAARRDEPVPAPAARSASEPATRCPPVPSCPAVEPPCTGDVDFGSLDWEISGGPTPVKGGFVAKWPCGTYNLDLKNRRTPQLTMRVSVTVKRGDITPVNLPSDGRQR